MPGGIPASSARRQSAKAVMIAAMSLALAMMRSNQRRRIAARSLAVLCSPGGHGLRGRLYGARRFGMAKTRYVRDHLVGCGLRTAIFSSPSSHCPPIRQRSSSDCGRFKFEMAMRRCFCAVPMGARRQLGPIPGNLRLSIVRLDHVPHRPCAYSWGKAAAVCGGALPSKHPSARLGLNDVRGVPRMFRRD